MWGTGRYLEDSDDPADLSRYFHDELEDCSVCPSNTYQDIEGTEKCQSCGDKVIADNGIVAEKHDNKTDCKEAPITCASPSEYRSEDGQKCEDCTAGNYCDGITKFTCNFGYYCIGDGTQQACPPGTFSDSEGEKDKETCQQCLVGTYNQIPGRTSCDSRCPPGTFNLKYKGAKNKTEACGICPLGSFCQVGTRIDCPKGTYNDQTEKSSSNDCKNCDKDTYNDQPRATKKADCISCGKDPATGNSLRTKTDAAINVAECEVLPFTCPGKVAKRQNAKGDCENCPPGTHGDGRGESCVLCALGFYQDLKGQLECKSCTPDTCRSMFGATSNIDHFKTVSLPEEFQHFAPDTTTTTTVVAVVNIVKEDTDKAQENGLSPPVATFLYTILSAIALSVVLFHRFLPMRFKEADIFFAGDHFVEDTVRCVFICFVLLQSILIVFILVVSCSMQNACLTHVSVQQCRLRFPALLVCYASPSLGQTNY